MTNVEIDAWVEAQLLKIETDLEALNPGYSLANTEKLFEARVNLRIALNDYCFAGRKGAQIKEPMT